MIRDVDPVSGSRIRILIFYPSWIQCCGSGSGIRCFFDPGIRDKHPGSAILLCTLESKMSSHQLCCKLPSLWQTNRSMATESHNFKFDIYLLTMTENVFIVILGLQGHKIMGKTCAPKMFCFLRHPNTQCINKYWKYTQIFAAQNQAKS